MGASLSRERGGWVWLLLALALARGLFYMAATPPWQAPDETGHFENAWLTVQLGRLPSQDDLSPAFEGELIASLYEWRYGELIARPLPARMPTRIEDLPENVFARTSRTLLAGRFSLAYLWQALFLLPMRAQELALQLIVARFSSVLLNLGIVWLAFRTFRELAPAHPRASFAMALVIVLMPQHTYINSTVGDGPLAELMSCAVLYGWVRLFREGARPRLILVIAVGTALAVLSKATAVFLLPLNGGLAFWWYLRQRRQPWSRRRAAYLGIGVAALGAGAWIASQFGLAAYTGRLIESLAVSPRWLVTDNRGTTLEQALLTTHDSFWAYFGWMVLPVSPRWYGAILLLTVGAAIGWRIGGKKEEETPSWAPLMMVAAFLAAFTVFAWTGLLSSISGIYQTQGRYLFPVVIPFVFLLVGGWLRLLPVRQNQVLFAGILFLALFDAWSMVGYFIPYFYYR